MVLGFLASFIGGLFGWAMGLLSLFLILLVLVQRGRGGGLTGALGGPGGQSAFGSKAGDMFTRITFIVAGVWILLCALAMWSLGNARSVVSVDPEGVIGETSRGGGVVPPRDGQPGSAPAGSAQPGATPDLSGLGDLSELLNQSGADAPATETPDAETPDADAAPEDDAAPAPASDAPAEETPGSDTPAADAPAEDAPAEESEPAADAPPADPS